MQKKCEWYIYLAHVTYLFGIGTVFEDLTRLEVD